jgi:hypothetical protein
MTGPCLCEQDVETIHTGHTPVIAPHFTGHVLFKSVTSVEYIERLWLIHRVISEHLTETQLLNSMKTVWDL